MTTIPHVATGEADPLTRRRVNVLAVCERTYNSLIRYAGSLGTRNEADAEDAVQAAFLGLWTEWDELVDDPDAPVSPEGAAALWGYLAANVRGRMLNANRNTSRRERLHDMLPRPEPSEAFLPPDRVLDCMELERDYQRTLTQLSEREREVFLAIRRDGVSYQVVAERLGVSRGAVQTYLSRAMEKLNNGLASWVGDGEVGA